MAEAEGGGSKRRSQKKVRRKEKEKEKTMERRKRGGMKNSRRVGDLEWGRKSSKVRGGGKIAGS